MTFDEQGNEVFSDEQEQESETPLEISEYKSVLEALTVQNENLETVIECQADIISLLSDQNAMLVEMNQNTAYIFVALLVYGVYRFISGVLSSMFGGG